MKLCITAVGNSIEARTDNSFGRAPWLIIVDTEQNSIVNAIENRGVNASQGAGIAAAQAIADQGADGLLTGRVGPKAQAALQAAGVKIYEDIDPCTVREALDRFKGGQYRESTAAAEYGAGCGPGKGSGRGGGGRGRGQGRRGGM
jgi:predicted Fe-Mo cluster-binding NifX family protein